METQTQSRKLRTCIWIVNQLRIHREGLTFAQLNEEFARNEDLSHGQPMHRNTFKNYQEAILDLFRIAVSYDHHSNRYAIELDDTDELASWLINTFSVGQLVRDGQEVRDRILLEPTPQGMRFFHRVVEAIRKQIPLQLSYQKFADVAPNEFQLSPYSVKLSEGRWYIVGRKDERSYLQCFAFDRILDLQLIEGAHFSFDLPFDPHSYFAHSFGIFVNPAPQDVVIRVYGATTYHYLHTKPLHASQQEELLTDGSLPDDDRIWLFRYHISPSPDFRSELLRWGAGIEVVSPPSFRHEIQSLLSQAARRYDSTPLPPLP
ncbi:MAG: WYL domain-containing protein [Bacteroidales bacterium]|nr:WYL domain-containing protein [Bacteroidales bacterium]